VIEIIAEVSQYSVTLGTDGRLPDAETRPSVAAESFSNPPELRSNPLL
jgi:hypothetical protein